MRAPRYVLCALLCKAAAKARTETWPSALLGLLDCGSDEGCDAMGSCQARPGKDCGPIQFIRTRSLHALPYSSPLPLPSHVGGALCCNRRLLERSSTKSHVRGVHGDTASPSWPFRRCHAKHQMKCRCYHDLLAPPGSVGNTVAVTSE